MSHNSYILALVLHSDIFTTWDSWRWKKQMGAGGHQLWPVSQVTTLAIVTSRLKPHVYIPRSCSGSAGSCPFTFTPTNELGAKHDVITPIWSYDGQVVCSLLCLSPHTRVLKQGQWPTFVNHRPLRLLGDQWTLRAENGDNRKVFVRQMWFIYQLALLYYQIIVK